ncbi:probable G-protein coupled receptor 139 [Narcine bancroftii]|uniref:probable G-protein coupled receptor 139 n=1 Tax=Narcine bancroftii TaxID=1343680 RepID=UPI003832221D
MEFFSKDLPSPTLYFAVPYLFNHDIGRVTNLTNLGYIVDQGTLALVHEKFHKISEFAIPTDSETFMEKKAKLYIAHMKRQFSEKPSTKTCLSFEESDVSRCGGWGDLPRLLIKCDRWKDFGKNSKDWDNFSRTLEEMMIRDGVEFANNWSIFLSAAPINVHLQLRDCPWNTIAIMVLVAKPHNLMNLSKAEKTFIEKRRPEVRNVLRVTKALNNYHLMTNTAKCILCHRVNLLAIVILSRGKCGLSTCTTHYLVAMAAADSLVILTEVILRQLKSIYFPACFLNLTPLCAVTRVLSFASRDCSVWFTVTFTWDRFVAICWRELKAKYCTAKTAAVVLVITTGVFSLQNVPYYFALQPREMIDNVPWFCGPRPEFFTDARWVGFNSLDTILTPLFPFAVILLLNALTVRHILLASRVRQSLRGQSKGAKYRDPELESRRRSVVLLFTLSGSFVFLWLTTVVEFLQYQIAGAGMETKDSEWIFHSLGFLLSNLSCCTNTFIYAVTQPKFREQTKSAVKYPIASVLGAHHKSKA